MTRIHRLLPFALLPAMLLPGALTSQTLTVFPDEYANVAEGPFNSPNYPFAYGTSRVQIVYEAVDLAIPAGHQIRRLAYRQDRTVTTMNPGRTLQLEVRMGYTSHTATTFTSTFANNYTTPPVTVFGPAMYALPNLRDNNNPLPNDLFFLPLTTPFTYQPANGNLVVEYLVYGNSGGGTGWTYYLDRSDYVSPVTYGPAGCPHSGNQTPNLTATPTRPGSSYSSSCTNGPGSSFALLLITPAQQLTTPFDLQAMIPGIHPTCLGQVPLNGVMVLTDFTNTAGGASWYFSIPNNPGFADMYWASQAAFFDFFAPGGVVVSNGAQVLTGAAPRTSVLAANGPPATLTTGGVSRNYNPVTFFEHQ